jgi:hypothetical protein
MSHAKKYIPNDDDRAKVLPLFCGPSKPVPPPTPIAIPSAKPGWRYRKTPVGYEVFRKGDASKLFRSRTEAEIWCDEQNKKEGLIK